MDCLRGGSEGEVRLRWAELSIGWGCWTLVWNEVDLWVGCILLGGGGFFGGGGKKNDGMGG